MQKRNCEPLLKIQPRCVVIFIYHVDCIHRSNPYYSVCQGLHICGIYSFSICCFFLSISLFIYLFYFFFTFKIQPIITLEGSISHMFHRDGKNKVTVQVACGSTVLQDSKVITVKGEQKRQTSKHFIWCYMNMQYGIWGKCNVSRSALRAVPCVCQRSPT